jgi:hypothetical protein
MLATLLLAALTGVPHCWDVYDAAVRTSARSAHPLYVSYDERISVLQDDRPLMFSVAHVDYRDDGLARVSDERYDFHPIVTRHTDPGPPVLGPYGSNRQQWLPQEEILPTIASVRGRGSVNCAMSVVPYKNHTAYRLDFSGQRPGKPALMAMWVDTASDVIWKVIVTGDFPIDTGDGDGTRLAEFQVELGYHGPYLVVNHVVWSYHLHQYSQISDYFGEYTLTDYSFPTDLPASDFALVK